ncbi:MAG: ABC transporter ATP-binding protein [Acidobacteriota bacterium]|nr:MAG: ABC transporter ATP-binding protein [Acidobacteriota bacterium]
MTRPHHGASDCDFDVVAAVEVSRHYGRRRALAGVTGQWTAGTITGLFGPNGAGKSTLLGVLSTLLRPSGGTVRYGDRDARAWGDILRSRIGVLGHDLFLYPELTARENLIFFGRLYGMAPAHLERSVETALKRAGLAARADDRVGSFSRGMRQRLAAERALLHGPRLVLFDEPFTGLDDASVERMIARLRELREQGAIVLAATHDLEIAEQFVDGGLCLQGGRIVTIPPGPEPLRARYRRAVEEAA